MIELQFKVKCFDKLKDRISNNYTKMHGVAGRLFGDNCYGDKKNSYLYTPIVFENGYDTFYFRTETTENIDSLKNELSSNNGLFNGSVIAGVRKNTNDLSKSKFQTVTPIILSKKFSKELRIDKSMYDEIGKDLTQKTIDMLLSYGYDCGEGFSIKIIKLGKRHAIKVHDNYKFCFHAFLEIKGDEKAKELILLHGLGRSCSQGFGFIK